MTTEVKEAEPAVETKDAFEETRAGSLDAVTRERLAVAESAARFLEELADSGALGRLDPAVAEHLFAHARRLTAWLSFARMSPTVRADEDAVLALRRLERRLEVALEILDEQGAEDQRAGGSLFYGDFTGRGHRVGEDGTEVTEPGRGRSAARGKKGRRGKGSARGRRGSRIREARRLTEELTHRVLRLGGLLLLGAVIAIGAVAFNKVDGATRRVRKGAPPMTFERNTHLEDMKVFFPAVMTVEADQTLSVLVDRAWLLTSVGQRQEDAAAAHVWLLNRNVTGLILRWSDGTMIGSFEDGKMAWHETLGDGGEQAPTTPIDWGAMNSP